MSRHHCRCRFCGKRKKLRQHPLEYLVQPRCVNCRARSWRRDNYRHQIEVPQMRAKIGRYQVCSADCFHFSHRLGCAGCKFASRLA